MNVAARMEYPSSLVMAKSVHAIQYGTSVLLTNVWNIKTYNPWR
jgi:hypothetical protein